MRKIVIAFQGNENIAAYIVDGLMASLGEIEMRKFPDGETYVRLITDVLDKEVVVVATLHRPDDKFLSLVFLLRLLRDGGASKITLVAPYLAYMRQDKQFKPGEAVTSTYFSELISPFIDELVTIDPHLHRHHSMNEIYSANAKVLHASKSIATWIKTSVSNPLLIGPDSESEQWVSQVAALANAPYIVLNKERHGDRNVEISFPEISSFHERTPVLVDDIISTAHTMIVTAKRLLELGFNKPICIGVHAIFADNSFQELQEAGAAQIVTCNTIAHSSNGIDLSSIIIDALQ
ncbi:MAG TPA: ribose-phosphate pyrophosphokinase [Cyclobacteriaceae bacterium]|nr:ribose-phosphate pyrophosphokinase [Cyclobacteriaceae bacterium]HMV07472.1 ribose-phosphate pyrophosphokinase [Cyclobacteriaceae bacterium]HMW99173.1 ribose-phosphate pyrophosphokinase [Cyclobacteriaceae bacterium]HMX48194.1 ribose-phosphate pyrophosphokinase [Cyclobacteriaceae bacterium]HMY94999.1 ribose-phosphate pyrophosphokinase [Cyclobacteriaceae bacterium]